MKHLKQSLCIIIAVLLLTSPVNLTFSADYDSHWAAESINMLLNSGILSGDGNGDIRPDDSILRAEFVKVVNKAFGYVTMAAQNFSDVLADKWYAPDFLIAKENGYIIGDPNGNARPEDYISRIEICVILARILNLTAESTPDFADSPDIPNWASGSIAALAAAGYISGYEDGSFRGERSAARAEAFHIIKKITENKPASNPAPSAPAPTASNSAGNVSGMTSAPTTSIGGASVGGSSSSGPSVSEPNTVRTPIITGYNQDTNILSWGQVYNAASYEIGLVFGGVSRTMSVPGEKTTADVSGELTEIYKSVPDAEVEVNINMRAKGSGGNYSGYSKTVTDKILLESLPAPDIQYKAGIAGGLKHAKITWSAVSGASTYNVEFYVDDILTNDYFTVDATNRVARITDLDTAVGTKTAYVQISAISADLGAKKNSPYASENVVVLDSYEEPEDPILQTGDGSALDPLTISKWEEFDAIRTAPGLSYRLIRDIKFPDGYAYVPFAFSGTLDTDGPYRSITVQVDKLAANTGLFSELNGAAKLSNIILKGSVNGGGNFTGGFAGIIQNATDVVIDNCVNMASVTGAGTSTGGIVGYSNSINTAITNCVNFGAIDGTGQNVGGIVGYANNLPVLSRCQNHGTIVGKNNNVGGVAGVSYADVTYCFNSGSVTTTGASAGGVTGSHRYYTHADGSLTSIFSHSYNLGNVTGASTASGLTNVGSANNSATATDVSYSYSVGSLSASNMRALLSAWNMVTSVTNLLYLTGNGNPNSPPAGADVTAVSVNELKGISAHAKVTSLLANGFEFIAGYDYPVLSNNLPKTLDSFIYKTVSNLNLSPTSGTLNITWDTPSEGIADIEKVVLTVTNNTDLETIANKIEVAGNSYAVPSIQSGCWYGVRITAYYEDGGVSEALTDEIYVN